MKKFIWKKRFSLPEVIGLIGTAVICVSVVSYAVTVPHTFVADTVISATEVNENFQALVNAVTTLESQVATIQANNALLLDPYLTISSATINGLAGPHVILHDANLHIQSGSGATDAAVNGLGNLLVGYNEAPISPSRGGSHNLIVGPQHNYPSYGGFMAGRYNTVSGIYSSVSGGEGNTASGGVSSVSGGYINNASSGWSSISGGADNTASGDYSSVSGGFGNGANAPLSSISGGYENAASGYAASVSGGFENTASNWYSSISGGRDNTADGGYSVVGGGWSNTASGMYSSVSGGYNHSMTYDYGWMACGSYSCSDTY
jgi:hypothetical protein